jgi:hypothetical protein
MSVVYFLQPGTHLRVAVGVVCPRGDSRRRPYEDKIPIESYLSLSLSFFSLAVSLALGLPHELHETLAPDAVNA